MSCFCILTIVNIRKKITYNEVTIIGSREKGWIPSMRETTILGVPSLNGFVSPHGTISIKELVKLKEICCNT
jgi:hypothetical protein